MITTEVELAVALGRAFREFGSDKSTIHDYHRLYAPIVSRFNSPDILEIGLGTPHLDVVSTMGKAGHPGGSLRAFRACAPGSRLYGADYDRRILFHEDRIKTFFVDQTRLETFSRLPIADMQFDLMIDDGLHSPHANLHSLEFFLPRLKVGGFAVIEDLGVQVLPLWEVVRGILGDRFRGAILKMAAAHVFVVQRTH